MRIVLTAVLILAAAPVWAQAGGGSAQHTTTTTQTTTTKTQSGDTTTTTTTTHTDTTTSGGGISFGNPFHQGPGKPPRDFSYETLGGKWKIGEATGNKMCELTLESKKFISSYGARTGIGCPEGLFGVSSWMLAGEEIRLMSPGGSTLAKLWPSGRGRWDGKTEKGLEIFMVRD